MAVKKSLTVKLLLVVGSLASVVIVLSTIVNYLSIKKFIEDSHLSRAKTIATALDASITRGDIGDSDVLYSHIYKLVWLNPEILDISIGLMENGELKIVASNSTELVNNKMNDDYKIVMEKDEPLLVLPDVSNLFGGFGYMKIITPIHISGQVAGVYALSMTTDEEVLMLRKQFIGSVVLGLAAAAAGVIFVVVSIRFIVIKPIKALVEDIHTIGEKGGLVPELKIKSWDEIGVLTQEFNLMGVKLNESFLGLENLVSERTKELTISKNEIEKERLALMNILEDQRELDNKLNETNKNLLQSQKNLSKAQELAHLGSWEWDIKKDKLWWSDEVYRIFGLKVGAIKPNFDVFMSYVYPEDRPEVERAVDIAIKTKNPLSIEHRIVTATKKVRILQEQGEVVCDEKGEPIKTVGTVLDITKNKEYEMKLKESFNALEKERDRIEGIITSMGEGLLVINRDYKIEMINPIAEQLLDTSKKEAIGTKWSEFVGAFIGNQKIPEKIRTSMSVIQSNQTIYTDLDSDHYYLTRSGKRFPVVSVTTPLVSNNVVVGAVKVFRDATDEKERKLLIEHLVKEKTGELKEEQEKSHSILENTSESIVLTDSRGNVTYINPSFTKLFGFKSEDIEGKNYADFIKAYDLKGEKVPSIEEGDAATLTATKPIKRIYVNKKGEKIAVSINASPVNVEGEFKGVVRIIYDYSKELELQQQKDDFFSIASHELRTPLTVISGNLDMLTAYLESKLSPQEEQILNDSIEASDRLIRMVNDFLNVSRLDQGRLRIELKTVDICKLLEDVINEMKLLADTKGIKLVYIAADTPHKNIADEGLFREILVNLIGNSIKFTRKGEVRVEHLIKGKNLVVRVSDTGIGIAADKRKLLFQRFQQAMERTISRDATGTGLGLYISREFAKLMGGDLALVKSEMGKGSVFELILPLSKTEKGDINN